MARQWRGGGSGGIASPGQLEALMIQRSVGVPTRQADASKTPAKPGVEKLCKIGGTAVDVTTAQIYFAHSSQHSPAHALCGCAFDRPFACRRSPSR
jgi:hypothetical protein